jgi:hypothetical protein
LADPKMLFASPAIMEIPYMPVRSKRGELLGRRRPETRRAM